MKSILRKVGVVLAALLMTMAPGMNFALQRRVLPETGGIVDFLYQACARTGEALSTDSLALAVLCLAFGFLASRTLFHKPKGTGVGEYLLCAFLAGMMLLNRSIREANTVALLYANRYQMLKSLLYLIGMYLIYLSALRAFWLLLNREEHPRAGGTLARAMGSLSFGRAFLLLFLCWLPHLIVKYPGVLMWDTYHQIKQYLGEYTRANNHPPLGTLIYGLMETLGRGIGHVNLAYFAVTLLQTGALLAVLSFSLARMRAWNAPAWVRVGALCLFAVSPVYVGWATVICKDTAYLILALLAGMMLLEYARAPEDFGADWKRWAALVGCFVLLWLTRYNGVLIVAAGFAAMLLLLLLCRLGRQGMVKLACAACATVVLALGANEALLYGLQEQRVFLYDVYTLPFQQTAMVAALHHDEIPQEERDTIDRVLDFELASQYAGSWYADAVKDTYRQTATAEDRAAYLRVWFRQLLRYPVENLDAVLIMNGVLFDLQFNRPMYVSLTDNDLTSEVYPYSFNDMTLYDREEIAGLNAAQRALTQWYFSFDDLPLLGWFATMGFATTVLLMIMYLMTVCGRRRAMLALIPSAVTLAGCLFAPVAYLRYALPYVASLPLWFAAYFAPMNAVGEAGRGPGMPNRASLPGAALPDEPNT